MRILYSVLVLPLVAVSLFGQPGFAGKGPGLPEQPDAVVQKLYREVVARHPLGLPSGANWQVFAPYLSKRLRHSIDLARSCQDDWARQNQGRMVKEPFAWGEAGLFSGANELVEPSTFKIERTLAKRDGSFLVYVKLGEGAPPEKPWSWEVAVRVVTGESHALIDDVIYLKGKEVRAEYRLSELLTEGCDGSHWIDHSKQQPKSK